jgi:hypothetical protein
MLIPVAFVRSMMTGTVSLAPGATVVLTELVALTAIDWA